MTDENKVIPFPQRDERIEIDGNEYARAVPVEIDGIMMKVLFFDGNHMWVDVYHRRVSDGGLGAINTEPVELGPGSVLLLKLGKEYY